MMRLKNLLCTIIAVIGTALITTAAYAGAYGNVVNKPFATVSNGPQNAVVLDVNDVRNPATFKRALETALARTKLTRAKASSRYAKQAEFLTKAGLIPSKSVTAADSVVMFRYRGQLLMPNQKTQTRAVNPITRAYGNGTIAFSYDTAWSTINYGTETQNRTALQVLQQMQALAIPIIDQVYGKPATSFTLRVTLDDSISDRDAVAGGLLIITPTERIIKLPKYSSARSLEKSFLHLIIHAYHDSAMFSYDAWEEGFSRAATVIVGDAIDRSASRPAWLPRLDIMGQYNPALLDAFYYLLNYYELLNQPALGNNKFLTSWTEQIQGGTMTFGGMLIPRLGMSASAWLKVYTERKAQDGQSFFKLFNERYYTDLNTNAGLRGNVPLLKNIATVFTPNVEGKSFSEWYSRQYVLDTSVSTGNKLYVYTLPQIPENAETNGYSVYTFLINYTATSTGDELPLSGRCFPVYWNYSNSIDLYIGSQYEEFTVENGEAYGAPTFFTANLGGDQRVTMDFAVNGASQRIYVPVGFTGNMASENDVYGAVIGGNDGSVSIQAGDTASSEVTNGGFGAKLASGIGTLRQVTFTYTSGANTVTKKANAGPGSYAALIESAPVAKTLTRTFPAGYSMVSLPVTPYETDHAQALGGSSAVPAIGPSNLYIAYWDFDRYLKYPNLPAFKTGRGYWLRFPAQTTVKVTGETTNTKVDYRIPLVYGWNMVGCPFETSIPLSVLMVEYGNLDPVTFEDAWIYGIISQTVLKYVPAQNDYGFASSLEPWTGYWVYCRALEGAVLVVPHP